MEFKTFVIGFNKTASRSIDAALYESGLDTVHWDSNNIINTFKANIENGKKLLTNGVHVHSKRYINGIRYEDIDVFSDITHSKYPVDAKDYYKQLDADYPGSKFILNIRDVDKWVLSRMHHGDGFILRNHLDYYQLEHDAAGIDRLKSIWRQTFIDHVNDVNNYFKTRKNDLLIFNIEEDKIPKIGDFLGIIIDDKHYKCLGKTNYNSKPDPLDTV